MTYTREEFVIKLQNEDFKSRTVTSFCKENDLCLQTTLKYLNEYNIPYNKRKIILERKKDQNGRYCKSDSSPCTAWARRSKSQPQRGTSLEDYEKEAEKRINIAKKKKNSFL